MIVNEISLVIQNIISLIIHYLLDGWLSRPDACKKVMSVGWTASQMMKIRLVPGGYIPTQVSCHYERWIRCQYLSSCNVERLMGSMERFSLSWLWTFHQIPWSSLLSSLSFSFLFSLARKRKKKGREIGRRVWSRANPMPLGAFVAGIPWLPGSWPCQRAPRP